MAREEQTSKTLRHAVAYWFIRGEEPIGMPSPDGLDKSAELSIFFPDISQVILREDQGTYRRHLKRERLNEAVAVSTALSGADDVYGLPVPPEGHALAAVGLEVNPQLVRQLIRGVYIKRPDVEDIVRRVLGDSNISMPVELVQPKNYEQQ